ncbi:anthranilate phosphoribosyltransferase [Cocleimonas sp. KMM 6892]|uniref:anthranilate phosphoribosyltransferase n=1 Tax=unclassified Cocleimonas TaxID=2639732 RepID=UPI002DBAE48F|nr:MULTISPECIES: anthranilate phosphoribosyltransferase [unclassified Cocleimonas]MEB8433787.1 anthranilate phosphoribosyltransferase [Cocleimonas sp. KMM 6892]MEC4716598.1 anthranilate phosphoribosyltransferase [Cocleimonas sp. KMM 6895]MEC4746247.1 anthranilate phosphoribosyltransferase [Cocleimonas sp. KMM 6896]
MNIQSAINKAIERENLSIDEMTDVMHQIMTGQATDAQIGGFLIAMRMKGETVEEIAAAAKVMRSLATPVNLDKDKLVEIVGTGGDGSSTFNISTASCLVVAAAGGRVAKHGNRSVSSSSGAADLLEASGVNLEITADQVKQCVDDIGVGFMFAPKHHSAMKHAIGPRKEMGARTLFNLLGPLTSPAGTPNQVLGVFSKQWVRPVAEVLLQLGSNHVMVVHGKDGMDEISISTDTYVAELKDGEITEYTIKPEDFGLKQSPISHIRVKNAEESLAMVNSVLNNDNSPARDIVALNAGAAIYVAGLTASHQAGVERALEVIESGAARQKLLDLIHETNSF